jgi:hypothetical protein
MVKIELCVVGYELSSDYASLALARAIVREYRMSPMEV